MKKEALKKIKSLTPDNIVRLTKNLFNLSFLSLFIPIFCIAGTAESISKDTKRKPTLLYILDSKNGQKEGQIIVLERESGTVQRLLKTEAYPDFALSADGKRIYVTSTSYASDNSGTELLTIIDAKSGKSLREIKISNRLLYNVIPPTSALALSASGRFLYIAKYEVIGTNNTSYWIEVFDTKKDEFLPERVSLPLCGWTKIVPTNTDLRVQVHCTDTQDIRLIDINERGAEKSSVVLTSIRELSGKGNITEYVKGGDLNIITGTVLSYSNRSIFVTKDGQIFGINENNRDSTKIQDLNLAANKWIRNIISSSDGTRVFLGLKTPSFPEQKGTGSEIISVNLKNPTILNSARISQKIDYLAISRDNRWLYAVDTENSTLTIINSVGLNEVRMINNIGVTPSLILEAPEVN